MDMIIAMECLHCENCKAEGLIYYCLMKNDFIYRENVPRTEKIRDAWKKGNPRYEIERRKKRKEI